jgi:hypothetical protein
VLEAVVGGEQRQVELEEPVVVELVVGFLVERHLQFRLLLVR